MLYHLAHRSAFADSVIIFCAKSLPWMLLLVITVYFLFFKKSVVRFAALTVTLATAGFVSEFLKWIIFRHPRPFAVFTDVVPLIQMPAYDSFPSSHAAIFAALSTCVYFSHRKLGVISGVVTLIIVAARVAAGVHFPKDILTGLVLGVIVGILLRRGFERLSRFFFSSLS